MKRDTAEDKSGKPDAWKLARPVWGWGQAVMSALHHLIRRKTKDGKFFWGCSDYPSCRAAYSDQDGKPNYAANGRKEQK